MNIFHKIKRKLLGINSSLEGVGPDELKLLLKHADINNVILEIGVFKGQTTKRFSENNFVVCIDPFKVPPLAKSLNGETPEFVYKEFMKNNRDTKICLFPMTSEETFIFWDKYMKAKIFDLIFVDGDHSYKGVETDFKWVKYLKEGGYIAFHDTNLNEIGYFLRDRLYDNDSYKFIDAEESTKVYQKLGKTRSKQNGK